MDLFSRSPKSFKIKDKSPVVEKLKSAISEQLLHFIPDYFDECITEYIVVLVSNGKHQFRAREDLDAFLDARSGEFVSWLWNLLLQYAQEPDSDIHLVDAVGVKPAALEDEKKSQNVTQNVPSQVLDITDNLQEKEVAAKRMYSISLLVLSSPTKKARVSVWDRLGKPMEDISFVEQNNDGMDEIEKYQEINTTQKTCTVSKDYSISDVTAKDNFYGANSAGQKSHFGEMCSGTGSPLVSSKKMDDSQNKEILQAQERPSISSKEELQFIKQKLDQAEQEIALLRSKQLEVQKRVESLNVSNVGTEYPSLEDISSRTVFVTNVHYAATEEALFEHFYECGFIFIKYRLKTIF